MLMYDLSSNGAIANVLCCDNDLLYDLSSNGAVANVLCCDNDLLLEGKKLETLISRKRREQAAKMHRTTFTGFNICQQMTP